MYDSRFIGWYDVDFGALLRRSRVAAGLTQDALAERSGVSAQAISALERGWRRRPHHDTVAMLANGLGLEAPDRDAFAALACPASPRGPQRSPAGAGLPVPATPLVGRQDEVATACKLLAIPHVRLVNVTGPPGVGKTRLAQAVAEHAPPATAAFVDLARVADARLVPCAVGRAAGLPATAGQPTWADLASLLARRRLLLLLDNLEHLLPAAPGLAELLGRCPELRLVTTSRAVLHVNGEHELLLRPPPLTDAIRLFSLFVRARSPEFAAAGEALPAVVDVCRRLDRLPRALALAAPWVTRIGLDGLRSRLDLDVLAGGAMDLPEHQRSMLGTLAWSWALLGPEEQALLRRASAFAGGASLEALEAVAGEGARPGVLSVAARLVDAHLVHTQDVPEGPRFGMLGVVREYARRQLLAAGEAAAAASAHARYFAGLARRGGAATGWRERERHNLRIALGWARAHGEAEAAAALEPACAVIRGKNVRTTG